MNDPKKSKTENDCKALLSGFQGVLSWKWDDRFETLLAEFGVDNKDSIRAILEQYLHTTWDNANIDSAPDAVRMVNDRLGNLMAGQLLFTSDPNQETFIFCAWWPWGDGKTISLRIAPFQ